MTRLKDNADYLVVERRPVPAGGKVLADEVISFYGLPGEGREYFFRRVEIYDAEQQRRLVFLSNHLQFAPTTVAAIYKERWQVELFFKALKQLLQNQDLCRHQRQCGQDPGLDGTDCHVAAPPPAAPGPLRLGLVEPAGPVTSAIVCASRPVDLAGRSLPASPSTSGTATGTGSGLNETAELRHPRLNHATTAKVLP